MPPSDSPTRELSSDRRELLALLLAEDKSPVGNGARIKRVDRHGRLTLSFVQERMWVSERLAGGTLNNATTSCVRANGKLDIDAFRLAINEIVRRHEIFRTRFVDGGSGPVPQIAEELKIEVPLVDLRGTMASEREAELRRRVREELGSSFDLTRLPLLRIEVLQVADDEYVFAFAAHHITFDGWSGRIFLSELSTLYEAYAEARPVPLGDLPIQYVDFAAWQRDWAQRDDIQAHLEYWKRQLGGALATLELPTDRPRASERTFAGAAYRFQLPESLSQAVTQIARDEGVTPFMILLAAFDTLLHRCSGQDEVIVGSPVANRHRLETAKLIGCFMHPLVLRVNLSGDPSFRELLDRVRRVCLSAYAHQDAPFELVARALHAQLETGRLPLFQTLFNVQQAETAAVRLPGLTFSVQEPDTETAMLDLSMNLWVGGDHTWGVLEYSTELFDASTIEWLVNCFQSVLESIVSDPDCRLSKLPIAARTTLSAHPAAGLSTGLSADRRALLELMLAEHGHGTVRSPGTGQPRDKRCWPASFGQERLWFFHQLHPGNLLFNQSQGMRLDGLLDVAVLVRSLNEIVRRHEVLRTSFEEVSGRPMQRIADELELDLPLVDLTELATADGQAELNRITVEFAEQPFDLAKPPLFRMKLVRLAPQEHILLLTVHHIISDGWSLGVFRGELATLYRASLNEEAPPMSELPMQYADYAVWQRQWYREAVLAGQLTYWKRQLGGKLPVLTLPTDRPRPVGFSLRRKHAQTFKLSPELGAALDRLGRREGTTLFMTLLASFQTLLYRYTGQTDVIVDSPIAGRNRVELEAMIGFFVNSLALRTDLSGRPSFLDLLRRVRQVCLDAYSHQDLPFDRVIAELQPNRYQDGRPLASASFMLHEAITEQMELAGGLRLKPLDADINDEFDLTMLLWKGASGLSGTLQYDPAQFDASTVSRMVTHFITLLEGIVAAPQRRISELPLLADDEQRQLLVEWDNAPAETRRTAPAESLWPDACVQQLFEAQAARTPEATAIDSRCLLRQQDAPSLWFAESIMRYGGLNRRANQLARHLQSLGAGAETRVAICLERSPEMLVAVLGVLKAGAAYVPLDATHSAQRLEYMLKDSEATIVITTTGGSSRVPDDSLPQVLLDRDAAALSAYDDGNLPPQADSANLAYVMYTSGSTGKPKGALIPHRNLTNAYWGWDQAYHLRDETRCHLQMATFSFDVFAGDFVRALCSGAKLVLCPREVLLSPQSLFELLRDETVDTAEFVPAVVRPLMEYLEETGQSLDFMRLVIVGSDTWNGAEYERLRQLCGPRTRVINSYGVAEATIDSSYFETTAKLPEERLVPIGRPFVNTRMCVLDAELQLLPIGVPGELYLGGAGLARSYLNRPELTATRFIPDPFSIEPGARLYRTGDLARVLDDGNLQFLGRVDNQVKIRGFRIEPGEIESVLVEYADVAQAVVIARSDDGLAEKYLVAYLVVKDAGDRDESKFIADIHKYLQERLPAYMVPSAFALLERLPLSPNGKVDRQSLPAPDSRSLVDDSAYLAPRNEFERQMAGIWSSLLRVDRVGVQDNFFELGGDSIMIIRAVARARELGISLSPQQMFQHQTIAALSQLPQSRDRMDAEQNLVAGPVPLTPIQHWFFDQLLPEPSHYNQSVLLEVRQALDPVLLEQAVGHLWMHHDALRMQFVPTADGWEQRNQDVEQGPSRELFLHCDLRDRTDAELPDAFATTAAQWQASLDLTHGPLMRVVYFDTAGRRDQLLILIHHLVVDGVSWRILLEDLLASYEQLRADRQVELPAKTTSFQQWARRLEEYARTTDVTEQASYWLDVARTDADLLPRDHAQGDNSFGSAETVLVHLDEPQTQAILREVVGVAGPQISDVLLTALTQAVTHWTGGRSLLFTLEGHGREPLFPDIDLSRTVGSFTSLFPVRLEGRPVAEAVGALQSVREQLAHIPQQGIGYGLLLYLRGEEAIACELGDHVSEICFKYLGQLDQTLPATAPFALTTDVSPAVVSPAVVSPQGQRAHVLDVNGMILGGRLHLAWTFSRNLHRRETIEQVANNFLRELGKLIAATRTPSTAHGQPASGPSASRATPALTEASIRAVARNEPLPLSFAQQRLWFLDQLTPGSALYNGQVAVRLRGRLDISALHRSFAEVVRRHEVLRTCFPTPHDEPVQAIQPPGPLPLPLLDLSALSEEDRVREAQRLAQSDASQPFDLARGPLIRVQLVRLGDADHVIIVCTHHIIGDAWSVGVLVRELAAIYEAFASGRTSPLPEVPIQYADFAAWQRRWLQGPVLHQQLGYWKQKLAQLPTLDLPIDFPRPASDQTFQPAETSMELDAELSTALRRLSQREGSTLFMTLFAAFNVLLSRYSGQDDLVVGTPIAGRNRPEVEDLIGFFVNMLVLRTDLSGNPSFRELLRRVRETAVEGYAHQDLPFEKLVEELHPARDPSRTPLFQVFFNMLNLEQQAIDFPGLTIEPFVAPVFDPKFDLTLDAQERNGRIHLWLGFNAYLFSRDTVQRLGENLRLLLAGIVAAPDRPLGELPILSETERALLLEHWNATDAECSRVSMPELFESQADKTPDAIAVVFPVLTAARDLAHRAPAADRACQSLTYAELNRRANQLARHLRLLGVGPEAIVGICLERSLEMIVGVLGILKAGAAYLPLDPAYPRDRLQFMLQDAQVRVLVTQEQIAGTVADVANTTLVRLDTDWDAIARLDEGNLDVSHSDANTAYVIYTSGSTGKPKGVMVPHRALTNFLMSMRREPGLNADDVLLAVTTLGFDIAGLEIFLPLIVGARIVVAPRDVAADGARLAELLRQSGATAMQATPATWRLLLEADSETPWNFKVLCGGEQMPRELADRLLERSAAVWNLYGPTETTVWSTAHQVEPGSGIVSIGRPVANTHIYVLDGRLNPVPIGVLGDLYIGGTGLTRGYLGRAALTAERFVPHPFSQEAGARLYRTGDVARWRSDGNLEFLGRGDHQVKLRGFRIELGEIEAVLGEHPAVKQAVVVAREDVNQDQRLVAYIVPHDAAALSAGELRSLAEQKLPHYMGPSAYVVLSALPLTPNGKVDRKSLPAPEGDRQVEQAYVAPRTHLEQQIAAVWREVLRVDEIGVRDNFFDLGGHSLLVVQIHKKLVALLGPQLTMMDLFQFPTVEALARHLAGDGGQRDFTQEARRRVQGHDVRVQDTAIAIVGMAGRLPGARDVEAFWDNLRNGVESITFFSDEELVESGVPHELLANPRYVKAKGYLEDADQFDAAFFRFSPRDAEFLDPQQRLFLECSWEALERAGYDPQTYGGLISMYAGSSMNSYMLDYMANHASRADLMASMANFVYGDKDHLATRVSYLLNLRGPSVTVQTACSTSLVAVHEACRSLLDRECDLALAGGVSVTSPLKMGYLYQPESIASPDGHCRTFDAKAEGTLIGNGAGVVVLKRLREALADGDEIYAVIRGTATNNDGSQKVGYTAPSVAGQAAVIALAQTRAGVNPETIQYVEAHGTGTLLGDPIEVRALTQVFGEQTEKKNFCALGSVKTNFGHLDAAAGVTGLMKTALALKHRQIPPSLHFEQPNPEIDLANSPFYVNTELREWPTDGESPRRAAVSSFGIGGTNAHAILEEAPERVPSDPARPWQLLLLSAKSPIALAEATTHLADYLDRHPDANLADVAYTLQVGRQQFPYRQWAVCRDTEGAIAALRGSRSEWTLQRFRETQNAGVAFLFPGQSAQHPNMARELYDRETKFRDTVDHCCRILEPELGIDLRTVIYPDTDDEQAAERLTQTSFAQPAIFVIEYALSQLWISWGVRPAACVGHSIGEYVAACLAGVFDLEDALRVVATRGKLMDRMAPGAMLAVPVSEADAKVWLSDEIALAAVNSPSLCVLSGPTDRMAELEERLTAAGIAPVRLHASHAFHSAMMDPILDEFRRYVAGFQLREPTLPYVSNLTGMWIEKAQARDPSYWASHLRQTVRFSQSMDVLLAEQDLTMLEVGPGRALSSLAQMHPDWKGDRVVAASLRHSRESHSDIACLLRAAGQLWQAGVRVDWRGVHGTSNRRRIVLPTYPFQRQRYWACDQASPGSAFRDAVAVRTKDPAERFYVPSWKRSSTPGVPSDDESLLGAEHCWLVFSECGHLGNRVLERLEQSPCRLVTVVAGDRFRRLNDHHFQVNPLSKQDFSVLVEQLRQRKQIPDVVAHLWGTTLEHDGALSPVTSGRAGFYSLLYLAQAFSEAGVASPLEIAVVTNESQLVMGDERIIAEKSLVRGPCRVLPQELANVSCRHIDMPADASDADVAKLVREIATRSSDTVLAYRQGYRWVQTYEPIRLSAADAAVGKRVRPGGVYLVTGGLGGMGSVLAQWLADVAQAKLVLTARTPLPERDTWAKWISEHGEHDPTTRKINRVESLENSGADVLILAADVCDEAQMRRVVELAEQRFGPINGVIHAAGLAGGGLVQLKTPEIAERVFVPKVDGLRVLQRAVAGQPIDFLVLCSSITAITGAFGQIDYCSANAFMDAVAWENRAGRGPFTVAINWNAWRDVGMAVETDLPADLKDLKVDASSSDTLSNEEGVDALRRILATDDEPQIAVSLTDLPAVLNTTWPGHANAGSLPTGLTAESRARPDLATPFREPSSATEQVLAEIWQSQFGFDRMGVRDDFMELGGHSLLALQMLERIRAKLAVNLSLATVFERRTIEGLASAIDAAIIDSRQAALETGDDFVEGYTPKTLADEVPALRPAAHDGAIPLSFAQEGAWFIRQLQPDAPFNIAIPLRLRGNLNLASLNQALNAIVRRQQALRTTFDAVDGRPFQVIHETREVSLPLVDLSQVSAAELTDELRTRVVEQVQTQFDLQQGPLFQMPVLRLADDDHVLLFVVNHIVFDGWSTRLFAKELAAFYNAYALGGQVSLPALPVQYADYAIWQRELLQGEFYNRELRYWAERLDDSPPLLHLATDRPAAKELFRGDVVSLSMPKQLGDSLRALANREGVTLFMLLLAAYKTLLMRYTGQEDLIIGTPIANRNQEEIAEVIGFCVNLLPLRTVLAGNPSFRGLMHRERDTCLGGYSHQEIPFGKLVQELDPVRGVGHSPYFQVQFALHERATQAFQLHDLQLVPLFESDERAHGLVSLMAQAQPATDYLFLNIVDDASELSAVMQYRSDLFESETISRLLRHLHRLLDEIVADADRPIWELPILDDEERQRLLADWSLGPPAHVPGDCIQQLFERQVELTPDAVAVVSRGMHADSNANDNPPDEQPTTYAELNHRANQLADFFRSAGIKQEDCVAICLERSMELIAAVLGVWKAGGTVVLLDPSHGVERVRFVLDDCQANVIVGRSNLEDVLTSRGGLRVIDLGAERESLDGLDGTNPAISGDDRQVAYIVYTSGSTGRPKGVMVTHRSVVNTYRAWEDAYGLRDMRCHLQMASATFDVFMGDVTRALCSGAQLVVCPRETLLDPEQLFGLLRRYKVDCAEFVPAVVRLLLAHLAKSGENLDGMKMFICGSDTWSAAEYQQVRGVVGDATRVINSYGVAEATIDSAYFEEVDANLSTDRPLPIGRPFAGSELYVLDPRLEPTPVGVPGELYIGGAGLARGYLNRPDLTAERFVPHPFHAGAGERLYRTGDRARFLADGNIEFIGRVDSQIKIRGFRIEPAEVEAVLGEHPSVYEVVVLAREDRPGDKYLAAYVVSREDAPPVADLRQFMQERLPDYMVPSVFMFLDAFPLTPSGKINRRALPAPEGQRAASAAYAPPVTDTQHLVVAVWGEVLGVERVGIHDNFFELGGHSLLAIQLMVGIREAFHLNLPLVSLFEHADVESLARYIDSAAWAAVDATNDSGIESDEREEIML